VFSHLSVRNKADLLCFSCLKEVILVIIRCKSMQAKKMAHPVNCSQLQFVWKLKHKSASRFQCAPRRSGRPVIISKRFIICLIGIQRLLRWNFNRRDRLAIIFVSSPGARASSILNILSIYT
jgi:hypothetical protein